MSGTAASSQTLDEQANSQFSDQTLGRSQLDSQQTLQQESQDRDSAMPTRPLLPHQYDSQQTLQHESQQALQYDSQHTLQHESQQALQYDSQHTLQHESQQALQYDSQHTLQHESQQALQYDSQHTLQHESQQALQHESQGRDIAAQDSDTSEPSKSLLDPDVFPVLVSQHDPFDSEWCLAIVLTGYGREGLGKEFDEGVRELQGVAKVEDVQVIREIELDTVTNLITAMYNGLKAKKDHMDRLKLRDCLEKCIYANRHWDLQDHSPH